jgi:hypothetical protein
MVIVRDGLNNRYIDSMWVLEAHAEKRREQLEHSIHLTAGNWTVFIAWQTVDDAEIPYTKNDDARARGAKGGAARSAALTPEQRTAISSKAARARWNSL